MPATNATAAHFVSDTIISVLFCVCPQSTRERQPNANDDLVQYAQTHTLRGNTSYTDNLHCCGIAALRLEWIDACLDVVVIIFACVFVCEWLQLLPLSDKSCGLRAITNRIPQKTEL